MMKNMQTQKAKRHGDSRIYLAHLPITIAGKFFKAKISNGHFAFWFMGVLD